MFPSGVTTSSESQIARLLADPANTVNVAKAHLLLGLEAEERNDWQGAAESYLRIVELAPADDMVRYFGHNNRAYALLQLKRFEEAQAQCMAAIEVDGARHSAYRNLGLACAALGRPADAAAAFMDAACRNLADARAWLHLQELVAANPDLLAQSPDLAERMAGLGDRLSRRPGQASPDHPGWSA
ncbi:MAG: tetratricopeptide repeat protein [Betaproteobacteria bacterium]|jgi:Flp pilus assembly protein TadD|nr:tetratricopeptide repeat protein [Rhodocyclales bacterium]